MKFVAGKGSESGIISGDIFKFTIQAYTSRELFIQIKTAFVALRSDLASTGNFQFRIVLPGV